MRIEQAVRLVEEVSTRPADFVECFPRLAQLIEARTVHMFHDPGSGSLDLFVPKDARPMLEAYTRERWFERDEWTEQCRRRHSTSRTDILTDSRLIPEPEKDRSALFQDFYRQWDVGHVAAWHCGSSGESVGFTVKRARGRPFTDEDVIKMQPLKRAANRASLLLTAFHRQHVIGFVEGLEASGRPAMILNRSGDVSYLTKAASRLVGRGFSIARDVPFGFTPRSAAGFLSLRQWILQPNALQPAAFLIDQPERGAPIAAIPNTIPLGALPELPFARVILMLIDLGSRTTTPKELLQRVFQLTAREAEVASLLGQGLGIAELSERLNLRRSSARQVTKSVLAKVGVHRQSELVATLSRLGSTLIGPK